MYILDTDYITAISRNSPEAQRLSKRLGEIESSQVVTTVITYEEQTRGWLSIIKIAKTEVQQIDAYKLLKKHLQIYCKIPVLDFDRGSVQAFHRLKKLYPRRPGTMDLKIAAIALTNNAIVLTRNVRDFDRIENLSVENWL